MRPNYLSFFNEQDAGALAETLLRPDVVRSLRRLGARVTMGLRDLSDVRGRVVRRLVDEGVKVDAWLLLPRDEGYFATLDNVDQVAARYDAFRRWAQAARLEFSWVGLDFEPDLRELQGLWDRPVRTVARWLGRTTDRARLEAGVEAYRRLVARMRTDGFQVEAYQFPVLHDERRARGSWWQRLTGVVDLGVDREVTMLYTSLMGPLGAALLESYAPECQAVGVGSTGGGIDPWPKLTWEALARDLRLAAGVCGDVRIFSLEGCVAQGFLERLVDFEWGGASPTSGVARWAARAVRVGARAAAQWLR